MTDKRKSVASLLDRRGTQVRVLVAAHQKAAADVQQAEQLLAERRSALVAAVQAEELAAAEFDRELMALTNDQTAGAVRGLHNWAERVRSALAAQPNRDDDLAGFLARLEGRLLDALEDPVVIDHNAIEREYQNAKLKESANV